MLNWFGNLVGSGIQDVLTSLIALLVGAFVDATRDLLTDLFAASTRPQVTADAFLAGDGPYHTVATFSAALMVGALILGVVMGLVSGEPGQAFARMGRQVPVAALAIGGLPWLVDQLLALADALAAAVLPASTAATLTDRMALPPSPDAAGLLLTLVVFLGGVVLSLELIVRDTLVMVMVALAPLSFAASVVPAARPAAGQAARMIGAAVLAKPAMFLALRIGIDQLHASTQSDGGTSWGQYLLGLSTVVVAAFSPAVVWRLIPLVEAYAVAQGLSRAPFRAAQQTAQLAYWGRALTGATRAGAGSRAGGGRGRAGGLPGGDAPRPAADREPVTPRRLPDPPQTDPATPVAAGLRPQARPGARPRRASPGGAGLGGVGPGGAGPGQDGGPRPGGPATVRPRQRRPRADPPPVVEPGGAATPDAGR